MALIKLFSSRAILHDGLSGVRENCYGGVGRDEGANVDVGDTCFMSFFRFQARNRSQGRTTLRTTVRVHVFLGYTHASVTL